MEITHESLVIEIIVVFVIGKQGRFDLLKVCLCDVCGYVVGGINLNTYDRVSVRRGFGNLHRIFALVENIGGDTVDDAGAVTVRIVAELIGNIGGHALVFLWFRGLGNGLGGLAAFFDLPGRGRPRILAGADDKSRHREGHNGANAGHAPSASEKAYHGIDGMTLSCACIEMIGHGFKNIFFVDACQRFEAIIAAHIANPLSVR